MKMKLPAVFAVCLLVAAAANALETDELIAISAMPLAVADVVALPDVPQEEVITVVTTLNQAAVPAPQFVEIVRYIPVALVEPAEPRFVTYVTQEYRRGIVGEPLALAIADRYETYGIDEIAIDDPPVLTVVEERQVLPEVVVTRFEPVEFDPLALVAMPLAVAAVADLADVPATDLMRFVASLNHARVPAPQFVEVVRYSPVVLVDRTASPQLIEFVTTEIDRGVVGRPLAFAIADRIESFQPVEIDLVDPDPALLVDADAIIPPVVVTTRVTRAHPHGGPPGQLKKELGLQTGAEVVHGGLPKRDRARAVRADDHDDRRGGRRARVTRRSEDDDRRGSNRGPKQRVTRSDDRGSRGESRVMRRVEQPRPQKVRIERGKSVSPGPPVVKQRGGGDRGGGNSGGGQGNGKGKGKGKG